MHKVSVKLDCPKCGFPAHASIKENWGEVLLFICPHCHSNVVYYDNKVDIISDRLLGKLLRKNKLKTCGALDVPEEHVGERPISEEDLIDLRITLETADSVESFLKKIS